MMKRKASVMLLLLLVVFLLCSCESAESRDNKIKEAIETELSQIFDIDSIDCSGMEVFYHMRGGNAVIAQGNVLIDGNTHFVVADGHHNQFNDTISFDITLLDTFQKVSITFGWKD